MRSTVAAGCFAVLLGWSSRVGAVEWRQPTPQRAPGALAQPGVSALGLAQAALRAERRGWALEDVELVEAEAVASRAGTTLRFTQRYAGLPVLGRAAALRVTRGRVGTVALEVARGLRVSAQPRLSAEQARAALGAHLPWLTGASGRGALAILPEGAGHLVWSLDAQHAGGEGRYLIDAHTGALLGQQSLRRYALGRVYRISRAVTPLPEDLELGELETSASPVRLSGWGGLLRVTNYVSGGMRGSYAVEQALEPSAGEDFLYDPPASVTDPTDAFAQVNLYYHLTQMRGFFGALGAAMSAPRWRLTAMANALEDGSPLDNAFFSPAGIDGPFQAPNLIAIGQGHRMDFAYDSDVFKHEFSHYVMHNAVGYNQGQLYYDQYGFSPFSGSIDEGLADYFACSESGDPVLGETALGQLGGTRDLSQVFLRCPEDLSGEVHRDGQLVGGLGWVLRERLGQQAADALMWSAALLLTPGAHLGDFAAALERSARDLADEGELTSAEVQLVTQLIAERGLAGCGRVQRLTEDTPVSSQLLGLDLLARALGPACEQLVDYGMTTQALQQYSFQPAPWADRLDLSLTLDTEDGSRPPVTVYVRAGEPVRFRVNPRTGLGSPADFDLSERFDGVRRARVSVTASSSPPFDASATYYVAITSESCSQAELQLSATSGVDQGGGGTAGTGGVAGMGGGGTGAAGAAALEGDLSGGGCACSQGPVTRGPAGWATLVGLSLLALGGRRSASPAPWYRRRRDASRP